jgi:hypothetical protein
MQDNGYMMTAEEEEILKKRMRNHENPQVPDKQTRQEFADRLRKRAWRKQIKLLKKGPPR